MGDTVSRPDPDSDAGVGQLTCSDQTKRLPKVDLASSVHGTSYNHHSAMATGLSNDMPSQEYGERDYLLNMTVDSVLSTPVQLQNHTEHLEKSPTLPNDVEIDQCDSSPDTPKYQFRPQRRGLRGGFTSTWLDQDQTGDYDPSEETRKARFYRNRLRVKSQQLNRRQGTIFDDEEADDEAPPKPIPNLMVKVKFNSETVNRQFKELVRHLPPPSKPEHVLSDGYQLRKRKRGAGFTYNDNYDANKSRFAPDLPEDPTGHPFARGCWECVALGHDCPLLTDETAWPCSTCLDDNNDCNLVTVPARKRACERCKRRRVGCSYTYTFNHGAACQQCMDDGHHCVAGPHKDAFRPRIRYDRDWSSNPIPVPKPSKARKVRACEECNEAGIPCSFRVDGSNGEPCGSCKASGDLCTLGHLVPQQQNKSVQRTLVEKRAPITNTLECSTHQKIHPVPSSCEETHKTIETKFSHPISFNCDEESGESCHFCTEPGYGILGLGSKQVEVIDWEDGRGLEEVSDGHRGDGVENTRMCVFCTSSRVSMIMCPSHEMQKIKGVSKNALNVNEALMELIGSNVSKRRQWCAICPSPASYQCCTAGDDGLRGCGLMLCEHCMLVMVGSHDGDLQRMLPELLDKPTPEKMLGLRADYKLLQQDGLLMRYVLWSNQQGV